MFVRKRLGATLVASAALVALAATVMQPASASAAALRGARIAPATTTSAATTAGTGRLLGVTLPGVPHDLTQLDQLSGEIGTRPNLVMWYTAWSANSSFPSADATQVANWGATPEITWEPWDPTQGVTQPTYSLARIAGGAFDRYLRSWAKAIKAWGRPLRLRFAHEMNGSWYPWAEGVNGNAPGSYVAAWKHVHSVFAAQGVTNVTWVWSPNVPYTGSVPLAQVYPGDAVVDAVGLDGYNWSTLQSGSSWTSFADVFATGESQLAALTAKPIVIGETGCPEVGGDKAQWISDMWATLAADPQVRSLMWFDYNKETDWRIDSSSTSAAAFAAGAGTYLGS